MARAKLSDADWAAVAQAYSSWVIANGRSPEIGEWPAILGDELFRRAYVGGYFGPAGTIPGFPPEKYADLRVKGVQVVGRTLDAPDPAHLDRNGQTIVYELYVDGELVATEYNNDGDAAAFAARHGHSLD